MLSGVYEKHIDKKGRIGIPKSFRDALIEGDEVQLAALYLDGCIQIYPLKYWNQIMESIITLHPLDPDSRKLQRVWGKVMGYCEVDTEGRIILQKELRDLAGIQDTVIVLGAFNRLEVWDKAEWEKEFVSLPSAEAVGRDMFQKLHAANRLGQ